MAEITDADDVLVQRMAVGDVRSLDELYTRHGRGILSYLIGVLNDRQLAEEVLQDVMLAAWRGAPEFRAESKVRTWLIGIARLQALNAMRKSKPMAGPLEEHYASDDSGTSRLFERKMEKEAVQNALKKLPADQLETLELIFYHDLSGPEAAKVLGVAEGTVKSRLHRAKAALRGLLQRKEVDNGW